jgi:hypothetical protein
MNRERAETFLRLLAEAEMREAAAAAKPVSGGAWSADSPAAGFPRLGRVAQALTAVHALDVATAEDVLADFAIAVGVRQHSDPGMLLLARPGLAAGRVHARARPGSAGRGPGSPGAAGSAGRTGPERFLPLGVTAPFHDGNLSGELNLLSYSQTAAGARLVVTWRHNGRVDPVRYGAAMHNAVFPKLFSASDDQGRRYRLDFTFNAGPDWAGEIKVLPGPPEQTRWLEFSAPGEPAMRISLDPRAWPTPSAPSAPSVPGSAAFPDGAGAPAVRTGRSAGEHLLNTIADRMLVTAAEYPQDLRLQLAAVVKGPLNAMAAALGDVVAALEAAEVLSPLSTVPGQLAALCASLRVGGHGLPGPPADLPEAWLSVLAHYQRRKPNTAPARDGHAAVAAAFPALDGIRLALLGLHNTDGETRGHLLVGGLDEGETWLPGIESVPVSMWLRDSAGRWHVAGVVGADYADGEYMLRLKLVPPLARSTAWIEVAAAWRSAEVRATVPLRWGYPP